MKKIKLTQGEYALVDDEDYEKLNQYSWHCDFDGYARTYFYYKNNKLGILMARQIMDLKYGDKKFVDHINHNTLDNRKNNLRIVTQSQNSMNKLPYKNKSSKYKGVSWTRKNNKWRVVIKKNGKITHIGYFDNEKEAAKAYNLAAKKYFGEYAYLNNI